jgi:hypothetical protein
MYPLPQRYIHQINKEYIPNSPPQQISKEISYKIKITGTETKV